MRVFELRPDVESYRLLDVLNDADMRVLSNLHDGPVGAAWQPLRVEWIEDKLNAGKPTSDFPTLGTIPAFSERAVDALLDLLIENGEILPLDSPVEKYFAYNATRRLDALDEERSSLVRFDTGRIMDVRAYEFFPEKVGTTAIFRLRQLRGRTFVTDAFANRIEDAGLTGFDLQQVWSG